MNDKVVIIGGGLAGLVNAILLARKGIPVTLYEKKAYPFHKVCGEYISHEVSDFLKREGLYPSHLSPSNLAKFQFTSIKGKEYRMPLDLGGFGVSRFELDHFLVKKAREAGATIAERSPVSVVNYAEDHFEMELANGQKDKANILIGAYGKNANIDKVLKRSFTQQRAPFLGVKYHIHTDFPKDLIALHNFEGGYCGISAVEGDKFNLCYLATRKVLKAYGSIAEMEEQVLKENPHLRAILENSEVLFDRPEVINEFTFKPKSLIEDHILMSGDTAGLITPLCGNGMAMAIHSAYLLSNIIISHHSSEGFNRQAIEKDYLKAWNATFRKRLQVGRNTQKLFGSRITSELAIGLMKLSPYIARSIMKGTHGQPF